MIAIADVKGSENPALISFSANLDPTTQDPGHTQWPSNRHNYKGDFTFADGHVESVKRLIGNSGGLVSPSDTEWRRHWNNDNLAHNGIEGDMTRIWPLNQQAAGQLDPQN